MNKILLVNKEKGITSNKLVNIIKRKFKLSKVGHAGTLDPFATGLMVVLCDEATKLSNYLMCDKKSYIAKLRLGEQTETLDTESPVSLTMPIPKLSIQYVKFTLSKFKGESNQYPPVYSALKVNGQKMCDIVRAGLEVDVKPRKINIYKIELISFINNEIVFYCECSKGTYIRSLGRDIAKELGTCGYLTELKRCSSGKFSIENSKKLDELTIDDGLKISEALDLETIQVDDKTKEDILNGKKLFLNNNEELVLLVDKSYNELAIYQKDGQCYRCLRGFHNAHNQD